VTRVTVVGQPKTFYRSVASHNQTALTAENAESAEEGK